MYQRYGAEEYRSMMLNLLNQFPIVYVLNTFRMNSLVSYSTSKTLSRCCLWHWAIRYTLTRTPEKFTPFQLFYGILC